MDTFYLFQWPNPSPGGGGGQICFPSFHSVNIAFIADCLTLDRSLIQEKTFSREESLVRNNAICLKLSFGLAHVGNLRE